MKQEDQELGVKTVLETVNAFGHGAIQSDDITMLACSIQQRRPMRLIAKLENLSQIRNLILNQTQLSVSLRKKLCLVAEEIFVNICSYAYEKREGWIDFSLEIVDQAIQMQFWDEGKPFDPTKQEVDIDEYDLETQVGGLGTWIAFGSVDEVHYEYKERKNHLILYKYLKEKEHENHQNH